MSRLAPSERSNADAAPVRGRRRRSSDDIGYVILRVGVGLLFLAHGLQKLFGLFGGRPAPIASRLGFAGVLETAGAVLLVLGFFTRPVALVLAGEMVIAYVVAHFPRGGSPLENGGELPLLYALIFAFLALTSHPRD